MFSEYYCNMCSLFIEDEIELISPKHTIDDLAEEAGTIGYEILTSLGARYQRRYEEVIT